MFSIVIKVSELRELVDQLCEDEMDFVEVSLVDADPEFDIPPSVAFDAFQKGGACSVSYDPINQALIKS